LDRQGGGCEGGLHIKDCQPDSQECTATMSTPAATTATLNHTLDPKPHLHQALILGIQLGLVGALSITHGLWGAVGGRLGNRGWN